MTDIGTIEKRTVYRIPEGDSKFPLLYVGTDPWPEGTVVIDGDMMPVKQQAIPWCTDHDRMYEKGVWEGSTFCDKGTMMEGPCHISTGGPDHKWWVDL